MFLGRAAAIGYIAKKRQSKGKYNPKTGKHEQILQQSLREYYQKNKLKLQQDNTLKYSSNPLAAWFLGFSMTISGVLLLYIGIKTIETDTTHFVLQLQFKEDIPNLEILETSNLSKARRRYIDILTFCNKEIDFDVWIGIIDETESNRNNIEHKKKTTEKQDITQLFKQRQYQKAITQSKNQKQQQNDESNNNNVNKTSSFNTMDSYLQEKYKKKRLQRQMKDVLKDSYNKDRQEAIIFIDQLGQGHIDSKNNYSRMNDNDDDDDYNKENTHITNESIYTNDVQQQYYKMKYHQQEDEEEEEKTSYQTSQSQSSNITNNNNYLSDGLRKRNIQNQCDFEDSLEQEIQQIKNQQIDKEYLKLKQDIDLYFD